MEQWWEALYEKRYRDHKWWSIPDADYVKAQAEYAVLAAGLKPPAAILDLGAGTGRHVAFLAQKGYKAGGLEYSRVLAEKGRALTPGIDLEIGDMRKLQDTGRYDAVTFFDTSFGIFDDKANAGMLDKVFKALKPGGWIVIDYLNPGFWKKMTGEITIPDYKVKGDRFVRRYRYDEKTYRLADSGRYISPDNSFEDYPDQILALYPPGILDGMIQAAGFSRAAFYGTTGYDYPGRLQPVSPDGASILAVAAKPS